MTVLDLTMTAAQATCYVANVTPPDLWRARVRFSAAAVSSLTTLGQPLDTSVPNCV